jgi:predicted enzyme related to lactoylglutathione lyase
MMTTTATTRTTMTKATTSSSERTRTTRAEPALVEFPADDPERGRRFWSGLLDVPLEPRAEHEGRGWQTPSDAPALGIHARGPGPGDTFSLPYFAVADLTEALERVPAL